VAVYGIHENGQEAYGKGPGQATLPPSRQSTDGTDPYHRGTPYGDRRPSPQTASSQTGWVRHHSLQDARREIADNYDVEADGIVVGWNWMGAGTGVLRGI
jgi:hypothetical protein